MSELPRFCTIKLQYLQELVLDHDLSDAALRVALYLAVSHADHDTGESFPTFATIGSAIGKCAKSVKRAINALEAAGYLIVQRGTNKGSSSRYRPTEAVMRRAAERRREGDKVVPLKQGKGGHSCPDRGTDLSVTAGQKCPPNKEQEFRNEPQRSATPDLPERGQSGKADAATGGLTFVPRDICFARDWDDRLSREGLATLERCLPISDHGRHRGFWLPGRTPAPEGSARWREQVQSLRDLIRREGRSHLTFASPGYEEFSPRRIEACAGAGI
ncbi:helix-turn-helix domain-containing protein [Chachezhania antarctica]|uniref:helix-turn-helix domain-containing protein n=1 Tax=Chachezhania antarctica TaxID=2340860 RepID=UPI000EABBD1D|nr:helix-turn-helix domain-containing protein [Chachezhania antarctica]